VLRVRTPVNATRDCGIRRTCRVKSHPRQRERPPATPQLTGRGSLRDGLVVRRRCTVRPLEVGHSVESLSALTGFPQRAEQSWTPSTRGRKAARISRRRHHEGGLRTIA
jgi:hypothetical protein